MKLLNKFLPVFLIFLVSFVLFWQFFLNGKIPLPADTIVGMYHPWRDLYARSYPNGIPFNNPLITDPVRQQFVWKKLVIDSYKKGELPIENRYSFSGYPLLANFQSGAFYPLNIIFFVLPFNLAWGIYIFLQFFLGGIFMFLFLRSLSSKNKNPEVASATEGSRNQTAFLGSTVWILSGFWIAWSEWGNILHTALWLPLILLAIDKILNRDAGNNKVFWPLIYLFSLAASFFAGHLQTFFYLYIFSCVYFLYLLRTADCRPKTFFTFFILNSLFAILTFIQWYPTLQFILASSRNTDIRNILTREDWFIPLRHLVQLFIPDYFGNPAKGNYFGVWNYGEYLSYIGIIPIFLSGLGIFYSIKKRKNIFWLIALTIVITFVTKNPVSEIPYRLGVSFFSTAQPSRLIFLLDFILIVFFAKAISQWFNKHLPAATLFFLLFILILPLTSFFQKEHSSIILRNSIQPVGIFILFLLIILIFRIFPKSKILFPIIFLLIFFDQSRVFWRFNTFAKEEYIFPETKITKFLERDLQNGFFRIASLNAEIMPPNFSDFYKIPSIDGYDPLYLKDYAKIISEGKENGFNRIVQLNKPKSSIFNQLHVKYILTFDNLSDADYELTLTEGKTKLYRVVNFK